MTRILLSYYKQVERKINKPLCFWDGLIQELQNCGNDVFVINHAYFQGRHSNSIYDKKSDDLILNLVKAFDPEVIITFMHYIPQSILDNFDVPIWIFDGDEISYFGGKSYLKENIERYNIFSIVKEWKKDYIDFGFKESQCHYLPAATAVTKKDIEQVYNVSFLGNRLHYPDKAYKIIKSLGHKDSLGKIVQDFLKTNNSDYESLLTSYEVNEFFRERIHLYPLFDYRWLTLGNMLDLGLRICGGDERWDDVAEFMPQITAMLDKTQVWTLEENADFYNSSKVSLCPMAPQARNKGFSWRAFDIMASNACLLSSTSENLKELTRGSVDIPMYDTPYKAREMCIELLSDENARKEICALSQKFIDENARWIHRFKEIESITNVKLVSEGIGRVYNIKDDEEFVMQPVGKEVVRKSIVKGLTKRLYNRLGKELKKKGLM